MGEKTMVRLPMISPEERRQGIPEVTNFQEVTVRQQKTNTSPSQWEEERVGGTREQTTLPTPPE